MCLQNQELLDEAKGVTCYLLPATRNLPFYGQKSELKYIEEQFTKQSLTDWNDSFALHGLGGVEKVKLPFTML